MEIFSKTEYYVLEQSLTKNSSGEEEGAQGITVRDLGSKGASRLGMCSTPGGRLGLAGLALTHTQLGLGST